MLVLRQRIKVFMLTWLGLRSRVVLLVLLALLPAMGLLLYATAQGRQTAFKLAESRLQSQAALAATQPQRLLENLKAVLKRMSDTPSVRAVLPDICQQYVANLQEQSPQFAQLGLLGLDGKPACTSDPLTGALDLSEADFFKQVLAGESFAIGEYGERLGGIGFGVPVYDPLGQLGGVAFAVVGLQELSSSFIDRAALLPGSAAMLLDRRGTVLATDPPTPAWLGKSQPNAVQGFLHAVAPVLGTDPQSLQVAISLPHALVDAPSRAMLALALLAVLLFGLGLAWCMGNSLITRPLRAILQTADEVGRGNLTSRVSATPYCPNEIWQISLALNRIAESFEARQAAIHAAQCESSQEHTLLNLALNSMSDGVIAIDMAGCFLLFNDCASQLHNDRPEMGSSLADWRQNHELLLLDGKTVYPVEDRPLVQALRGVSLNDQELLLRSPGLEDKVLRMSTRPLYGPSDDIIGGIVVLNDITQTKAAEKFAQAQKQVLSLIAAGAPLPESLGAIVQLIEESSHGSWCAILQVDGPLLRHGVGPSLPVTFMQAIDSIPIGEGQGGACGTAAFRKEAVVIEDVQSDPLTQDYLELLQAHNLRACWSEPVIANNGEVLATFAIYRQTPGRPQPRDLELIAIASRLARIALARKQAEAALVSSEARFRELAENIEDVFYNVDATTHAVRYISPGYEKIWGRSCQSLYANPRSHVEAVLAEDRPLLKLADNLNQEGQSSDVEYRILSTDGQIRWVRDRSYPVFNIAGVLERVVGTARNITNSKQAELALAATNRALQMLSRLSIAINRIEEEADLLAEVCRVAVDIGGYRMAWVGYAHNDEKKSLQPVAHAGDEAGYLDTIEISWNADEACGRGPSGEAIRSGQPAQSRDISKDATFCWQAAALERGYHSSIALPLREAGDSFGVLCLYRGEAEFFSPEEIKLLQELADNLAFGIGSLRVRQERLRSQDAARQAALRLAEQASLLDHAQDAIIVRNPDCTLRFWNQGAERLYGWCAQEVQGKTLATLMYRNPDMLDESMRQTLDNGGDWTGEVEQLALDGSVVHVESRCSVVRDEQGHITGVLSINTDIRERKRAHEAILSLNVSLEERVRQRTAQLELANQQLEAFSYSVSHDLRSPLNAIDGFSQLLEKNIAKLAAHEPLAERSGHYLARIRAGVVQMSELIDAMLSLAQVSRSDLRWEAVDLSALAHGLLAGYQERSPSRPAHWQIEPGLLAQGDTRLLKQVLDNLLGNAWKFTAGQARAEITLTHETSPSGETIYVVQDNGAGFDMAYASRLFGAFQRLHAQSEFAGTGIGLATVARIVERHNGRVWAEATPGKGARFYFTLGATSA